MNNELPVADTVAELTQQTFAVRDLATATKESGVTATHEYIGLIQRTCADRSKAMEKTSTLIAGLSPLAEVVNNAIDLADTLVALCATADQVCQENVNLTHTINVMQENFAQHQIRVPRPPCMLLRDDVPEALQHLPRPNYDEFTVSNSEASILSRIRFQLDVNQMAVGVVVLIADGNGVQVRNNFEFEAFIGVAESMLKRPISVDNTADGFYLYRLVLGHAVSVADATVRSFGSLLPTVAVGDDDRSDRFCVDTDTVGPELMFSDDSDDAVVQLPVTAAPDATGEGIDFDAETYVDFESDETRPVHGLAPDLSGDNITAYLPAGSEPVDSAPEALDLSMDADLAAQLAELDVAGDQTASGSYDAAPAAEDELSAFLGDDTGEVLLTEDDDDAPDAQQAQAGLFTVDPDLGADDGEGLVQLATEDDDMHIDVSGGDADVRLGGSPLSRFAD